MATALHSSVSLSGWYFKASLRYFVPCASSFLKSLTQVSYCIGVIGSGAPESGTPSARQLSKSCSGCTAKTPAGARATTAAARRKTYILVAMAPEVDGAAKPAAQSGGKWALSSP